jgi:nucleoid-associated protein YgaU
MGKFEKLVVLSVFLAVAVVLAVALNRGKAQLEGTGPLRGAEEVRGGSARQEPAPRVTRPTPRPTTPEPSKTAREAEVVGGDSDASLILNAGDESGAGLVTPEVEVPAQARLGADPVSDREHRILDSAAGLRPSFLDEYMLYTVAEGDTWSGLAQRFYQDGRYTRNLQQANDDVVDLAPGHDILVPVFDFIEKDAGLQRDVAATTPVRSAASTPTASTPAPVAGAPAGKPVAAAGSGQVYVVHSGDTLSDISKAVFGTATRWQELLDANTDVLKKPEALQVGMKLRIPAGGTVPAGPARSEAPATSKPKKSAAPAPAASDKPKVD